MQLVKTGVIGVMVLGAMVLGSTVSFAKGAADVKVLLDSAAALKTSHPDLAKGLMQAASLEKTQAAGQDLTGSADMAEATIDVKLLKDSSAALEETNPNLAAELDKLVAEEEKAPAAETNS